MSVSESVEEYLEALWISEESGEKLAHITWVAKHLGISAPSAVEMLKKLDKEGLVLYEARKGIQLADKGREIARGIIRGHRLIEVLMKKALKTEVREDTVCGMEHHMNEEFMDALCTLLQHPIKCPHGNPIPRGKCCS
ncbi:MAG: metal-dependent transcriptional regulator [Candidatus Bathyarchaeota archaeon]|nr:metal-dependent transcriptional regulator [Candidatus Bathyarchaeota archaeon]